MLLFQRQCKTIDNTENNMLHLLSINLEKVHVLSMNMTNRYRTPPTPNPPAEILAYIQYKSVCTLSTFCKAIFTYTIYAKLQPTSTHPQNTW